MYIRFHALKSFCDFFLQIRFNKKWCDGRDESYKQEVRGKQNLFEIIELSGTDNVLHLKCKLSPKQFNRV